MPFILIFADIDDRDENLRGERLDNILYAFIEERRQIGMKMDYAQYAILLFDRHHQRRADPIVRRLSAAGMKIIHYQRLAAFEHHTIQAGQVAVSLTANRMRHIRTLSLRGGIEKQDRSTIGPRDAQNLVMHHIQ